MSFCRLVLAGKESLQYHQNGDLIQCVEKLHRLQKALSNVDKWELDTSVIWSVTSVLRGEISKWDEFHDQPLPTQICLNVAAAALCCIRNTFHKCSRTQVLVAETPELLKPIVDTLQWTFTSRAPKNDALAKDDCSSNSSSEDEGTPRHQSKVFIEAHLGLASACITCLGNLIANNKITRHLVWAHISGLMGNLLEYPDIEVAQMACMVLNNFLLETDIREQICSSETLPAMMGSLTRLYQYETRYACFSLFCLKRLLSDCNVLYKIWPTLGCQQKCLSMDVLTTMLENTDTNEGVVSDSTISVLVDKFKSGADKILTTHGGGLGSEEEAVNLVRLLTFICTVAATDSRRKKIQQDASLLITSVYLLRCISEIGKVGNNEFTPIQELSLVDDEVVKNHPIFGFKSDLIRLIASLVYQNKVNQNQVREINGILLILESTQLDARNPLIKENAVFAMKNLLEGNAENQKAISRLQLRGPA
ncbi:unnamed protein product, partial [Meganyctiphanes norvegica]